CSRLRLIALNPPAATAGSTLSLHDALPIYPLAREHGTPDGRSADLAPAQGAGGHAGDRRAHPRSAHRGGRGEPHLAAPGPAAGADRKSTRLNSSHVKNSYAVFCLQKKTTHT